MAKGYELDSEGFIESQLILLHEGVVTRALEETRADLLVEMETKKPAILRFAGFFLVLIP